MKHRGKASNVDTPKQATAIAFGKDNYVTIAAGVLAIIVGFALMAGGGSDDPNVFNTEELYSFRRITLAPFVVILGYGIILYGIMRTKASKGISNLASNVASAKNESKEYVRKPQKV